MNFINGTVDPTIFDIVIFNIVAAVNIAMCIENSTIGFIKSSFDGVVNTIRQFKFSKYKVDLYFPDHNLIIECDENDHLDRDINYEKNREDTNGIMTREFTCKYDFTNGDFKISERNVEKCLVENSVYNGYYYRRIGSKLQVHSN